MKQVLQNYKTGELKVHDIPAPLVSKGKVLVANRSSLISAGTERATVNIAKKPLVGKAMARPDLVHKVIDKVKKDGLSETIKMVSGRLDSLAALGYSSAGEVIAVGEGVTGFNVGDRVACAGQNYASHAEVVQIPNNLCLKIPQGVSFDDASYVAVGAIALQGLRQADPRLGEVVAVIGLGLLGLILVQMLKANGCTVVATDLDPSKLAMALEYGADQAVLPAAFSAACQAATGSLGADAAIIVASTKSDQPVADAAEVCRKKGRVVVVGAVGLNLPREPYYLKELELRLSMSYGPGRYDKQYEEFGVDYPYAYVRWTEGRNMGAFLGLLANKSISLEKITTHRFDIDNAESAYELIGSNSEPHLGIVLQYSHPLEQPKNKVLVSNSFAKKDSSQNTIGISIVGTGNHVKDMLLTHINSANGFSLQGICSERGISATQLAAKKQAAYATSDLQQVLDDAATNAVLIGTRHDTHADMVLKSLKAGKHVFVEKPLCLSREELAEIDVFYNDALNGSSSNQNNVPGLMVGFNRRYSAHAEKIKSYFDQRKAPLVLSYRINAGAIPPDHWIQNPAVGGGRIVGEACHFIDLMQYVTGGRVCKVGAMSVDKSASGITEDQSVISLAFTDGSVGSLIYAAGGNNSVDKEYLEVIGDGRIATMHDFQETRFYDGDKANIFKTKKRDKGFAGEIASFAKMIKEGTWSYDQYEDDKATTLATFAAIEGMRSGESYSV